MTDLQITNDNAHLLKAGDVVSFHSTLDGHDFKRVLLRAGTFGDLCVLDPKHAGTLYAVTNVDGTLRSYVRDLVKHDGRAGVELIEKAKPKLDPSTLKAGDRVRYTYLGTTYETILTDKRDGHLRSTTPRTGREYCPWVVTRAGTPQAGLALNISDVELIEEAAAKSDNEQSKKSTVQIIGERLIAAAEKHSLCSEFDDFVDEVNGLLDGEKLPTRRVPFYVSVALKVEAASDVEARRIARDRIRAAGIDGVTVL